jgi:hypothetical protein
VKVPTVRISALSLSTVKVPTIRITAASIFLLGYLPLEYCQNTQRILPVRILVVRVCSVKL